MPKTTTQISLTEQLEKEIEQIQQALAVKNQEIANQQQKIDDFEEALNLLVNQARWKPQPGQLEPYDALQNLLSDSKTQEERQSKLTTSRAALVLAREAHTGLLQSKVTLEQQLKELRSELSYLISYAPSESKYRSAFNFPPTPREEREQQLAQIRAKIGEYQLQIQKAQWHISQRQKKELDPQTSLPYWSGVQSTPEQAIAVAELGISSLQGTLKFWEAQPLPLASAKVNLEFREFIKSRTNIEPQLTALLEAQRVYVEALEDFRQAIVGCENALEFQPKQLPKTPVLVELDERNKIILKKID